MIKIYFIRKTSISQETKDVKMTRQQEIWPSLKCWSLGDIEIRQEIEATANNSRLRSKLIFRKTKDILNHQLSFVLHGSSADVKFL